MDYLDFDLNIRQAEGNDYAVTVQSPAGEDKATLVFPYDKLALENRLKDLEIAVLSARGGHRQVLQPMAQRAQRFGDELFKLLLQGNILSCYDRSLATAKQQQKGLRLKLSIDAPALAALPWEFLYDARSGDRICLSHDKPLVRYLRLSQPKTPLRVTPPLRILAMAASPNDLPRLDLAIERQRMEQALHALQEQGLVELHWLPGQSWRDLRSAMISGGPWHIFHFIGHGGFDRTRDEGAIMLAAADGRAHSLYATIFSDLFADHTALRLVLLNACEGARGGEQDIFSSTAATLVRRGIPAVIAMQYPISDTAAIQFAEEFYGLLATGMPVDGAVAEARLAMVMENPDSLEWGTPVLYTHATDGRIFDVAPPARQAATAAPAPVQQTTVPEHVDTETQPLPAASARRHGLYRFWPVAGVILVLAMIGFGGYWLWPKLTEPPVSSEPDAASGMVAATETQVAVTTTPAPVFLVATATVTAHLIEDSATSTVTAPPSATPSPTTPPPVTNATAPPIAPPIVAVATPTSTSDCAGATPIPPATTPVWAAWQPFQTGQMLWLVHTDDAYLFFDKSGCWQVSAQHWDGRDYAQRWPNPTSTELHVPVRGFGYLWNLDEAIYDNETIYDALGYATQNEKGFCAQIKAIPGSVLIESVRDESCFGKPANAPNTAREGTWGPLRITAYDDGTWE